MAQNQITFRLDGLHFNDIKHPSKTIKNLVYINGELVPHGELGEYTWGYWGGGPYALAKQITKFLKLSNEYFEELKQIICSLPIEKNFSRKKIILTGKKQKN